MRRSFYLSAAAAIIFAFTMAMPVDSKAGSVNIVTNDGYSYSIYSFKGFFVDAAGNITVQVDAGRNSQALQDLLGPTDLLINISNFVGGTGDNATGVVNGTIGTQLLFDVTATDPDGTPTLGCLYPAGIQFPAGNTGTFQMTYNTAGTYLAVFSGTITPAQGSYTSQRVIKINITDPGAPSTDTTQPNISITSPATNPFNTTGSQITLSGTASDNVGVTSVTWSNDRGGSGTATGTTSWTAGPVSLQTGANVITVTARDAADNSRSAQITVNYSGSSGTGQYTNEVNSAIRVNSPFQTGGAVFGTAIKKGSTTYFLIDPKGFDVPYRNSILIVRIEDMNTINPAMFNFDILELNGNNDLLWTWKPQAESSGMYNAFLKGFTLADYNSGVKYLLKAVETGTKDTTMNVKWY